MYGLWARLNLTWGHAYNILGLPFEPYTRGQTNIGVPIKVEGSERIGSETIPTKMFRSDFDFNFTD